ncbi:MAG: phosphoribosylamine--glycine ligase [Patescibacteria group bacterium]
MNVLIIGSGAREDALAHLLNQSKRVHRLWIAPGNGGTLRLPKATPAPIKPVDTESLIRFAQDNRITLTIVGPEAPLAAGIVDDFRAKGLRIFGPTKDAARLEASKVFAKHFMDAHGIPTAAFRVFDNPKTALQYAQSLDGHCVIKADGLAAGKGAYVCHMAAEAKTAIQDIMVSRKYGDAGNQVIVEELLEGYEVSVHLFCDGRRAVLMPPSQDYKRLLPGDRGPNTGGMGAICPVARLSQTDLETIEQQVVLPTIAGMISEHIRYVGVLYIGIMMTSDGPRVLEYNCRLGDPETQVILPLLETDLIQVIDACIDGRLDTVTVRFKNDITACCIVLAAGGYPDQPTTGMPIAGLDVVAESFPHVLALHAGTTIAQGVYRVGGGRVLSVIAWDKNRETALLRANAAAELIAFDGKQYRTDIGCNA